MIVGPQDEAPRSGGGNGFGDTVTVAFGSIADDIYGIARVGLTATAGNAHAGGLGILFAGTEVVAMQAQSGIEPTGTGWGGALAAGVETEVLEPLRRWSVRFLAADGASGFALELDAASAPAVLDSAADVARLGGMSGYEHLVLVDGEVTIAGVQRRIRCLGQRGHSWGSPDWERLDAARTLSAWMSPEHGVTLTAVRPAGARSHAQEAIAATLFGPAENALAVAVPVNEPRLSTTYDAQGNQRHAGLELFVTEEDDYPQRAAGEELCGTTLDLGRLRLRCAFFHWRMGGREGVGRYDVLQRT